MTVTVNNPHFTGNLNAFYARKHQIKPIIEAMEPYEIAELVEGEDILLNIEHRFNDACDIPSICTRMGEQFALIAEEELFLAHQNNKQIALKLHKELTQ